jgi:hypothetical protein
MHDVIAALGVILAAGVSSIAAVLVARLRVENGTASGLLASIDRRTQRIEERFLDHTDRLGKHEARLDDHSHRINRLEKK